jgi:hypothetical protein
MKLFTHNLGCNLHQAATWINDYDLADKVLVMHMTPSANTIVVFRAEDDFDLDKWCDANNVRARNRRLAREKGN